MVRMQLDEVLVISLRRIETRQRDNLGDDWLLEQLRVINLLDVGLGDSLLLGILIEDGRAVLPAVIGALPVQLGGVVGNAEEDLQERAVGDSGGIVSDLD